MKLSKKTVTILYLSISTKIMRQLKKRTRRSIKRKTEKVVSSTNSSGSDLVKDNDCDAKKNRLKQKQRLTKRTMI